MIQSGVAPQSVTTYKEDESAGAFLNGDAIFLRNWPYVYALLSDPAESKIKPEQVGVSELPSADGEPGNGTVGDQDRKSTRLNSSHANISYAVFCLKKKKPMTSHNN